MYIYISVCIYVCVYIHGYIVYILYTHNYYIYTIIYKILCIYVTVLQCVVYNIYVIVCVEDPLEKEVAAHSSFLAWKIPWTAEPGRLPSMGSQRVGHA